MDKLVVALLSRLSTPPKKNILLATIGPPRNPPRRRWLKIGVVARNTGAPFVKRPAYGGLLKRAFWKNPYVRPWSVLVPLRVMTLSTAPDAFPNSAENPLVIT